MSPVPSLPNVVSPSYPPPERDHAIVLVHGAWVGEWSWSPVIPLLRRSGRQVVAVSLRGHGARSAESSPTITLSDHVDDVVGVVEAFDLTSITLVGHSYGGRVITRAWERLADRVQHMIYLDAHAPFRDVIAAAAEQSRPEPGEMIEFRDFWPDVVEFGGQSAVDWFMARVMPQSAATVNESFFVELPASLDKTYVAAVGGAESIFTAYAASARVDPTWTVHEIEGSHWLMVAQPAAVAAAILEPGRSPQDVPAHSYDVFEG